MRSAAPLAARMCPRTLDDSSVSRISSAPASSSAVLAGKTDLRLVIDAALERRKLYPKKTVLFVKGVLQTLNWAKQT